MRYVDEGRVLLLTFRDFPSREVLAVRAKEIIGTGSEQGEGQPSAGKEDNEIGAHSQNWK